MRTLTLFVLFALASSGCAAATPLSRDSDATMRARVVELVNAARGKARTCGRERYAATRPLTGVRQLDESAARHARDMARKKYFEHRGLDGSQPWDRIRRTGYQPRISGENIAYGPETAEEVVAGWLDSPGHCANIMDPRFEHIGVALARDGRKRIYWVQNFAAPMARR